MSALLWGVTLSFGVDCASLTVAIQMYLTDLTFIEEGNPDTIDGGLINFYKCERVAEVLKSIQFYQDLRHRSQCVVS